MLALVASLRPSDRALLRQMRRPVATMSIPSKQTGMDHVHPERIVRSSSRLSGLTSTSGEMDGLHLAAQSHSQGSLSYLGSTHISSIHRQRHALVVASVDDHNCDQTSSCTTGWIVVCESARTETDRAGSVGNEIRSCKIMIL